MDKFNFSFINKSNVLVGDIRLVVGIDKDKMDLLKSCGSFRDEYTSACKTVLAKENALLLRVDKKHFIDIDSIKCSGDCKRINDLLNSRSFDNNIFLTLGSKNPYVGQLILSQVKTYSELESSITDIAQLKLVNDTQK